jgi:hypothetical protein
MYDAIFSLHLAEVVVADKDPEKQKQWLKDNEFNYGKVVQLFVYYSHKFQMFHIV